MAKDVFDRVGPDLVPVLGEAGLTYVPVSHIYGEKGKEGMTDAERLLALGFGGTDCVVNATAVLKHMTELEDYLKQLTAGLDVLFDFDIDDWVEADGTAKLVFTREQVERIRDLKRRRAEIPQ